jgi:type IV pilus assembly protein PilW
MKYHFANSSRQLGMTLVELLVALVLGLFLVGGIVQVFVGNRVAFSFNEGLSRIQENARFSLEHIAYSTRMAGHSGCLSNVAIFNNLGTPTPFRDDIANGIQGHNANGTGVGEAFVAAAIDPAASGDVNAWSPALPAVLNNRVIPGSDVLIVRSVDGETHNLITPFTSSTQVFIAGPHDFVSGETLVVTDCQKASIFQLTGSASIGAGFSLSHSGAGGFSPGNATATWPAEQDYGLGAEVARHRTYAFYVGRSANNRPSLFQLRLQALDGSTAGFAAEELVEGVDTMQVRYGVDTDNDGDIDNLVSADAVANWTRVLSVELTLLVRAADEYGQETDTVVYNLAAMQFDPVDDRRFREVFSTTVGVRNRLP